MIKKLIFIAVLIFSNHLFCFSQAEESIDDAKENDEKLLDSLKSLMDDYSLNCYKIEISFSGYESRSDESWYYDSHGTICGYHLTWDMEGQSGEELHWFGEKGKLWAVYKITEGQENEPSIIFLKKPDDSGKLISYESETLNQHRRVFNAINDNRDNVSDDGSLITVTIEEIVNYGADFIQTTIISIDKELYELLL